MDLSNDDTAEEHLNLVSQVVAMQEDVDSDSESEIDDDFQRTKWGGSPREGKARNKDRGFNEAYDRLVRDYFSGPQSTHDETEFERRFRMPRSVFR